VGELGPEERRLLLAFARRVLVAEIHGDPVPAFPGTPGALAARGAFVTLRCNGELRGCIGHLAPDRPLAETVARMVVCAAKGDPRFSPVTADEVEQLQIEISVLSELVRVGTPLPGCVHVGQDGLIVRSGSRQGVLLPQVATEFGWDAEELLAATCRKAGLPADAWRRPAIELFVFQVDAFGE
jgi:AmmeMemoRadiSam system protein A